MRVCTADGCEKKYVAQGFCANHYRIARLTGEIQKLDDSHRHFVSDVDPKAKTGTCSVCGEGTPMWHVSNGRFACGIRGRATANERRKQESVRAYHKAYSAARTLDRRLYRHGITEERWLQLLDDCGGQCSICDTPLPVDKDKCIDHDHSCCSGWKGCGECVRAILCQGCNFAISGFKDSPELARRAADYLERFGVKASPNSRAA